MFSALSSNLLFISSNFINYSQFFEKKYRENINRVDWAASNNVFLEYDIIKKHKLFFDKALNKFGIGEDQLFYCNQRGISEENAVSLIVNGFCKDVFAKLPMEFAVEANKLMEVSLEGSVG